MKSKTKRTLTFPTLSDDAPIAKPTIAIANEESVIIREIRDSEASGNATFIEGNAGALRPLLPSA